MYFSIRRCVFNAWSPMFCRFETHTHTHTHTLWHSVGLTQSRARVLPRTYTPFVTMVHCRLWLWSVSTLILRATGKRCRSECVPLGLVDLLNAAFRPSVASFPAGVKQWAGAGGTARPAFIGSRPVERLGSGGRWLHRSDLDLYLNDWLCFLYFFNLFFYRPPFTLLVIALLLLPSLLLQLSHSSRMNRSELYHSRIPTWRSPMAARAR